MSEQQDAATAGPAVHFSSQNQEISPETSLKAVESVTGTEKRDTRDLRPEAQEELRQLKTTLQNAVQSKRMELHSFEPVSLPGSQPASRVPSGSTTPSRRLPAGSAAPSPRPSPPQSAGQSPLLTPSSTSGRTPPNVIAQNQRAKPDSEAVPQQQKSEDVRPKSSPQIRPSSSAEDKGVVSSHPKSAPRFSIGPSGDSLPASEDATPAATPGTQTPGTSTPKIQDSRHSSLQETDSIEARFRFGNRDPRQGLTSSNSGTNLGKVDLANMALPSGTMATSAAPSSQASSISGIKAENKRHSFFGGLKHEVSDSNTSGGLDKDKEKSSSKSNLKRFFKFGGGDHHKKEKPAAPPPDTSTAATNGSVPFADDHGLQTKYGKFGKVLGTGAGGSVRLMKRTGDGKTFAVKQFRTRHTYESEKDYSKKVTAEFCIGSTLHHGNIIETIDIVHEKGNWYEVMEYAPFDLFATVMTGKMGRDEVTCCTLQILSGVTYLHSMGLAHRDLKLDNVVINENGIMKIIDFGSAVVFRYPFENDIVLATGVVGSDPYLAPEVYENTRYDPQPADIWSIAIIFCCMCLRRFPWKAPRTTDNSYRLFVSPPDPGQEAFLDQSRRSSANPSRAASTAEGVSEPPSRKTSADDSQSVSSHHHHHHRHHGTADSSRTSVASTATPSSTSANNAAANQTIKGPLRLLRLLPRDSRHLIGRMLELDPKKRATIDEILEDQWVSNALVCRQEEGGQCFHAPNHSHILEGGGMSSSTKR